LARKWRNRAQTWSPGPMLVPCVAAFVTALGMAGCARPPPPTVALAPAKIQPKPPSKPLPHPIVVTTVQDGKWLAGTGADCAQETGLHAAEFQLTLPAPTANGLVLSMSFGKSRKKQPSGPIRVEFRDGPAMWAEAGRLADGLFRLTLPGDATTLSKFLALFEGGTLSIVYPGHRDRISVPRAGAAQQKWFECAKKVTLE